MLHSMTAFSVREINTVYGFATWKIRSVNHRYLDINVYLPEQFFILESIVRGRFNSHLSRGRIDCSLKFDFNADFIKTFKINQELINRIISIVKLIKVNCDEGLVDILKILNWPGVLVIENNSLDDINQILLNCFYETLDNIIKFRISEGLSLEKLIRQRLVSIDIALHNIKKEMPQILIDKRKSVLQKFRNFNIDIDINKLEQELFIFIQKCDISEELDRLSIHIEEAYNILMEEKSIGRKLDFLMQEFNREINTLIAKSNDIKVIKSSIEIKVLIEQIREQIQNVE